MHCVSYTLDAISQALHTRMIRGMRNTTTTYRQMPLTFPLVVTRYSAMHITYCVHNMLHCFCLSCNVSYRNKHLQAKNSRTWSYLPCLSPVYALPTVHVYGTHAGQTQHNLVLWKRGFKTNAKLTEQHHNNTTTHSAGASTCDRIMLAAICCHSARIQSGNRMC